MMSAEAWLRASLVFVHLMLCVFALYAVLQADLRVLRRRVGPRTMKRTHARVAWLLAGLWLSGLAIIGMDIGTHFALLAERPKLLTKLLCVLTLTLNGVLLNLYAMPRISAQRPLASTERYAMAVMGGVSTASWLMAAFIGVARPLAEWTPLLAMSLYAGVVLLSCAAALVIVPPVLARRGLRADQTALEEAAETLRVEGAVQR
jgi:hypothetical protein